MFRVVDDRTPDERPPEEAVSDMDTGGMRPEQDQPESSRMGSWWEPPTEPIPPSGWVPPGESSPPPLPAPPARPPRRPHTLLAAVLAGLVLLSGGIGIGWGLTRGTTTSTTAPGATEAPIGTVPQPSSSATQNLSLQAIADRVNPAVVDIVSIFDPAQIGTGSSSGSSRRTEGAGTGMILTPTGAVLTNNHVIEGSTTLRVSIEGRAGSYTATVVGANPTNDIALIQIEGVSGLPTVTLTDSSSLKVGQRVVAIGNALGRGGTPRVTEGTVTGLDREITAGGGRGGPEHLTGLIQTDAPISPGESGGPLVNSSGQVVGMITASARFGRSRTTSNMGYAISINTALDVVTKIRSGQADSETFLGPTGFLGVEVRDLDQAAATRLGLGVTSGALVVGILSGTPADEANISRNSVITAVDGQSIESADALGPVLHAHKPGDQVRVTWVDGDGSHTATVTLIEGPAV
jgi:S1-C subfamily serine protease